MTMTLGRIAALATATLLLPASLAFAHGAWVAERHGALYIVYGHGAADDAYDPAKVTSVQACTADLVCRDIARKDTATHVEFDKPAEGTALIRLGFDNGYWSKDAAGEWHNLPKDQVEGATESGHYIKTGTYVVDHLATPPAPFGTGLEIRPLADPMALVRGDKLPVEVLLDGKPAMGAELTVDYLNASDDPVIVIGADGKAEVTIPSAGLNVLVAFMTTPPEDAAKADEQGHAASLAFALHHHGD